jgi:hypothetical protein
MPASDMRRVVTIYLVVYYALIAGAAATVWRSGLTAHLDRAWTLGGLVVACALGGLLAALSRR